MSEKKDSSNPKVRDTSTARAAPRTTAADQKNDGKIALAKSPILLNKSKPKSPVQQIDEQKAVTDVKRSSQKYHQRTLSSVSHPAGLNIATSLNSIPEVNSLIAIGDSIKKKSPISKTRIPKKVYTRLTKSSQNISTTNNITDISNINVSCKGSITPRPLSRSNQCSISKPNKNEQNSAKTTLESITKPHKDSEKINSARNRTSSSEYHKGHMTRTLSTPATTKKRATSSASSPELNSPISVSNHNAKSNVVCENGNVKPANVKPANVKTANVKAANVKTTNVKPINEKPANEKAANEKAVNEKAAKGGTEKNKGKGKGKGKGIVRSPTPRMRASAGDVSCLTPNDNNKYNRKLKAFEGLEKRLNNIQSEFWKTLNIMQFTMPNQIKENYKFVSVVRDDRCQLVISHDDRTKAPKDLPVDSINDVKEKIKLLVECCMCDIIELSKVEKILDKDNVNKLEVKVLDQIYNILDKLCSNDPANVSQNAILQKQLKEAQKSLKISDKKLTEANKVNEEKIRELEKAKTDAETTLKSQILELKKNLRQIENHKSADQADKKTLEAEIKATKLSLSIMTKKVKDYECTLRKDREDIKLKDIKIESMAKEITEHIAKYNALKVKLKQNGQYGEQIEQQNNKIKDLEAEIEQLSADKKALEEKVAAGLTDDSTTNYELLNKLSEAQYRIQELQTALDAKGSTTLLKHLEMSKLKQSEAEKRREIEKLKIELSKAQYNVGQLESQIGRDRKLLDVRCKLINLLQRNDKDHRLQLEEMYTKVGQKNSAITELSAEVKARTEEFRSLFSTVSAKQLELCQQERLIKLLEENNERSHALRANLEEKIAAMEDEISYLKRTLRKYEKKFRCQESPRKSLLFVPVESSDDELEDYYYYYYSRNRILPKRSVDIIVKKYEV